MLGMVWPELDGGIAPAEAWCSVDGFAEFGADGCDCESCGCCWEDSVWWESCRSSFCKLVFSLLGKVGALYGGC